MVRQAESTNPTSNLGFVSTSDGLRVGKSILALDAISHPGLSFLSQPIVKPSQILGQLLTSEDSAALMDALGVKSKPLFCPYNRPFSVGKMRFELLPSGCGPGNASLLLHYENQTTLYAPCIQLKKIKGQRRFQLRKTDKLILSARYGSPNATPPSRSKSLTKFEASLKQALASVGPSKIEIYAETVTQFFEALAMLQSLETPVTLYRRGFHLCKALANNSLKFHDQIQQNGGRRSREKVLVRFGPLTEQLNLRSGRQFQIILHHSELDLDLFNNTQATRVPICLPDFSYGTDYEEIIKAVKPKRVYFFGHLARSYAGHFQNTLDIKCHPLYTEGQPTLF